LLLTATAVPATAPPAATMPRMAPVDRPPAAAPTNPVNPGTSAGAPGAAPTTTVARVRNGATGTSFLHSEARSTTTGKYSVVRPSPPPVSMPST
jgi:hypothetical protein